MKYVKKNADGAIVEMEVEAEVLVEGLKTITSMTTVVYKDNPEVASLMKDYLSIVKDNFPLIVNHLTK